MAAHTPAPPTGDPRLDAVLGRLRARTAENWSGRARKSGTTGRGLRCGRWRSREASPRASGPGAVGTSCRPRLRG